MLVDGSLLSGDVAVAMNIANENSIADVVAHLRELDGDLLNDTLLHHGSGIWVLPAPSELERAEVINGEETTAVLAALRQYYDVVVVDTASRPDEHLLAALDQSDVVLVVCTPEIASLKNAARFLALAHELGYGDEKLKLTINRLSSHGSIPLKDIESNLRQKMAFGLPLGRYPGHRGAEARRAGRADAPEHPDRPGDPLGSGRPDLAAGDRRSERAGQPDGGAGQHVQAADAPPRELSCRYLADGTSPNRPPGPAACPRRVRRPARPGRPARLAGRVAIYRGR